MVRSGRCTALVAAALLIAGPVLAQPVPADERISSLELEVRLLKRLVAEQDRRISALEKELSAKTTHNVVESPAPEGRSIPPSASRGWQLVANWARIRNGMSERQVIDILGSPTSTKVLSEYRTLFYRGEIPGSGFVSGNVELGNDRVYQVNTPVF